MKLDSLLGFTGADIGIDLGTANTLVYLRDHGIIIDEPSVVAVNQKTGRVVAVGNDAKQMLGRTPQHIVAIRPLVGGVISDFEITEELLAHFINKAQKLSKKQGRPRVVVGVPTLITNVETRAVRDAAINAGAKEVYIVEEPMAAAIGIRLPVTEPVGSMIIDIGGGTTDIAVISLSGIVNAKNLKIAGDRFNSDISSYIRDEFKILIGERTAEEVKIKISTATRPKDAKEAAIRGRDLLTGLPREVIVTDADLREALAPSLSALVEATKEVLETAPPEILADIMHRGIVIAGGGALIYGLPELLSAALKIPVVTADDPLTAVARGTGIIIENLDMYREVLIEHDNELPTR